MSSTKIVECFLQIHSAPAAIAKVSQVLIDIMGDWRLKISVALVPYSPRSEGNILFLGYGVSSCLYVISCVVRIPCVNQKN